MKMMVLAGAVSTVGGGMYLHGDFDGGEIYGKPVAETYRELSSMPVPREFENFGNEMSGTELRVEREPGEAVKWVFSNRGVQIGAMIAKLKPAGEARTRVTVAFQPSDADNGVWRIKDAQSFLKAVARPAMVESVDAAMEDREFNKAILSNALVGYLVVNRDAIQREALKRMDEHNDFENDNIEQRRAQASEERLERASSAAGKPTMSARPTVDTSRYSR